MTQQKIRVCRDMVRHSQYPEHWVPIPFERRFTASEYQLISLGSPPNGDVDFVWLSYLEDDTLYIHRWTGRCFYKVYLQSEGDEFVVSGAFVAQYPPPPTPWWKFWAHNEDGPASRTDADLVGEVELVTLIIDVGLLGKPDPRGPVRDAVGAKPHGLD